MQGLLQHQHQLGADPVKMRLHFAHLPPRLRGSSFQTLKPLHSEAFTACQQFAAEGEHQGYTGLLLSGSAGTGKTSLAIATLKDWVKQTEGQRPARFVDVSEILAALKRSFSDSTADAESILEIAQANDFLVIDDLGKQKMSDWVADQFYLLINTLYTQKKRVIITTNLPVKQLTNYLDYPVISRICQMCHQLQMGGADLRLRGPCSS
jgi:DNA replication protein DnaC